MVNSDQIYKHFLEHQVVCTDSRKISQNCIFFALRGDNFNGNIYALDALKNGASYAVVDEVIAPANDRILLVENVLSFLQQFANRYRAEFQIPIIAITGSNGKTTTKELIASVLGAVFSVHYTQGNFNNHIGVPLTLLQLKKEHQIGVIEMGANHIEEISSLCSIANPTHGLITNIGKAHLEGFGGMAGVLKGKGELFDYLEENQGVAFINQSEESLNPLLEGRSLMRVNYSNNSKTIGFIDLHLKETEPRLKFGVSLFDNTKHTINTELLGKYNVPNLLNAIAIGIYFRVPIDKIIQKIEQYVPENNRSQILKQGTNTFLLDAYNANPTSMKAAIEDFSNTPHKSKIAILGDMFELGEFAEEEHKKIANLALESGFEKVIFVGKYFPNPDFENIDLLKDWFYKRKWENCFFLLKGSRGIALEKLLQ